MAAFLLATKQVPYNCEIKDITFEDINKPKVKLTIHTQPEELVVTYFDLDNNHATSKSN